MDVPVLCLSIGSKLDTGCFQHVYKYARRNTLIISLQDQLGFWEPIKIPVGSFFVREVGRDNSKHTQEVYLLPEMRFVQLLFWP